MNPYARFMFAAQPGAESLRADGKGAKPPLEEDYAHIRVQLAQSVARICPPWLAAQREDIVQVAMMRVLEILKKTEGKSALPSSYLWKISYTVTVDEIRRLRRRREESLEMEGEEHIATEKGSDPEQQRACREIGTAIQECLGRLVTARRLAVALYLQGHKVPEAGRLLGWSAKKVENLVYRGLDDLRGCLAAKGMRP